MSFMVGRRVSASRSRNSFRSRAAIPDSVTGPGSTEVTVSSTTAPVQSTAKYVMKPGTAFAHRYTPGASRESGEGRVREIGAAVGIWVSR